MLNDMELCRTDGHLSVTAILHGVGAGGEQREERAESQQRKEERSPGSIGKDGLYLDPEGKRISQG